MAQAVDVILLKFEADIKDLRNELDSVKGQIGGVEKQTETATTKMSSAFKSVGVAIAAAFSLQQIVQFTAASIKLAAEAEGVKKAFDRLNDPTLLNKLRQATNNMVSDLELMKSAVKASNFKLPLDQLATYFEFATKRAKETGESVDYLVESIVLGISRKSIPILDNLGISAAEVQEEFQKTGDMASAVGAIIERSMAGAAESTHNYGDSIAQTRANIENLQVSIGEKLLVPLEKVLGTVNTSIDIFTAAGKILGNFDATFKSFKWGGQAFDLRAHRATTLIEENEEAVLKSVNSIENLSAELSALQEILVKQEIGSKEFNETQKEINRVQGELNAAMKKGTGIKKEDAKATKEQADALGDYLKALSEVSANANIWAEFDRAYPDIPEKVDTITASFTKLNGVLAEQKVVIDSSSASTETYLETTLRGLEAGQELFGSYGQLLLQLGEDQSRLAEFGKQLAFFEIASAQAVAIANAVKLASESAKDPISYFVFLSTVLSSIAVSIGRAKNLIEATSPPKFAEGVVDLKGQGTETSDSIWAKLSRGESVITAKATRTDRGLFEAANKMQLEDYIQKNYVLPALKEKQKEEKVMFDDYRIYLAMLNNQRAVKEGSKEVVRAIERKNRRYDWS